MRCSPLWERYRAGFFLRMAGDGDGSEARPSGTQRPPHRCKELSSETLGNFRDSGIEERGMQGPASPTLTNNQPSSLPPWMVMTFPLLLMNTSWVTGGEVPTGTGFVPAVSPGQACPSLSQEEMRLAANCSL